MEPYYQKYVTKKKPSNKGYILLAAIVVFLVVYFVFLEPLREKGSTCMGQGVADCLPVMFFSLMTAFIIMVFGWYLFFR